MNNKMQVLRTHDVHLAAALVAEGFAVQGMTRDEEGYVVFEFRRDPAALGMVDEFDRQILKVNLWAYTRALKRVRSSMRVITQSEAA